jgi:glutathione S-transferase
MAEPIKVYRHPISGHCHRVELMLSLLGLPFERIEVDLLRGAHKQPAFLAKNPLGQVPVIEDGPVLLSDSNAILVYLASKYDESGRWLPRGPLAAAQLQRWLSLCAGEMVRGPGSLRLAALLNRPLDRAEPEATSARLFGVMDDALKQQAFLVSETPTIADVAVYSYTALANEGGVSLEACPSLRAWLTRMEALPGFLPVQRTLGV